MRLDKSPDVTVQAAKSDAPAVYAEKELSAEDAAGEVGGSCVRGVHDIAGQMIRSTVPRQRHGTQRGSEKGIVPRSHARQAPSIPPGPSTSMISTHASSMSSIHPTKVVQSLVQLEFLAR